MSELVSNCVGAAAHRFQLVLECHHARVRVAAHDGAPGFPARRRAEAHDTSGRGLVIIDHLANAWGVLPERGGKTVWADVPVHTEAGPVFDCRDGSDRANANGVHPPGQPDGRRETQP